MSYGLNLNVSLVNNEDGPVECGVHMSDTENLDISVEKSGDDIETVAWDVFDEFIDRLAKATENKEETQEEAIARLEKENADLKARMEQLLNDEDVKTTKIASDECHGCGCCDCCDDDKDTSKTLVNGILGIDDLFDIFKNNPYMKWLLQDEIEKDFKKTPIDAKKSNKSSAKTAVKNQWKPISFI